MHLFHKLATSVDFQGSGVLLTEFLQEQLQWAQSQSLIDATIYQTFAPLKYLDLHLYSWEIDTNIHKKVVLYIGLIKPEHICHMFLGDLDSFVFLIQFLA